MEEEEMLIGKVAMRVGKVAMADCSFQCSNSDCSWEHHSDCTTVDGSYC